MSKEIGSAHNNLFQNILGREDMARDFVRYYMPAEIVGDLDLDTLEVASESYVSDDLKESLSDIVLSLQLKDGDPAEPYILMEHKSGLHKGTRLQLLNYMNAKWHKLDKAGEFRGSLAVIIPVVFYHGKKKWRYSLEFSDQFNLPGEHYRRYVPKFEHILHEVPEINKRKIKSTIALEVFHIVLECIFYPEKRDRIYESLELLFQGLNMDKAGELFYVFVKYLLSATDVNPREVEKRVKHLPKGEETVRTTAEVLRKEGYDRGYDKGVVLGEQHGKLEATQETLIDVAGERYGLLPSVLEAKIKSITSITTLKNLARQVVKLDRMEDFGRLVNKAVDH
jgi:predicted transposase/invertase (TIGR01784 family)